MGCKGSRVQISASRPTSSLDKSGICAPSLLRRETLNFNYRDRYRDQVACLDFMQGAGPLGDVRAAVLPDISRQGRLKLRPSHPCQIRLGRELLAVSESREIERAAESWTP